MKPNEQTKVKRPCAVCGESQHRKRVWEKWHSKVLCYACASKGWTFDADGNTKQRERRV
jgi:formylmethanofuran dehydrogenase subunit E